jgi:DNA (cytosine-5)-methyltransferase 1
MENVPQIINLNNIEDYEEWNNFLNSLGYTTFDGIVNSHDVGVAQWRRRFFAVSILNYKGTLNNKKPIMEILNDFYKAKFKYKQKSLRSIIKTKKDFIKKQ